MSLVRSRNSLFLSLLWYFWKRWWIKHKKATFELRNSGACVYQILREWRQWWDGMWIMDRMSSLCCGVHVLKPVVLSLARVRPLPPICLFLRRLFLIGRCVDRGPICVNKRCWALLRAKGRPPAAIRQTLCYCFILSLSALCESSPQQPRWHASLQALPKRRHKLSDSQHTPTCSWRGHGVQYIVCMCQR